MREDFKMQEIKEFFGFFGYFDFHFDVTWIIMGIAVVLAVVAFFVLRGRLNIGAMKLVAYLLLFVISVAAFSYLCFALNVAVLLSLGVAIAIGGIGFLAIKLLF